MKKVYLLLILLLCLSCKTNEYFYKDKNFNVTIYRFLFLSNYNTPLNEESFWYNGKHESEFAIQNYNGMDEKQMLNFLNTLNKSLPENPLTNPFEYHYAFVFRNKDTIYSNVGLNEWKLKSKGKVLYFSGPNQNTPNADISFCDFFTSNPIFCDLKYVKYPIENK